jgi:prepilin-type N-terminal cleavage/methylation domain-containing protein
MKRIMNKQNSGFTLIEVLVSMALSLLVMAIIGGIFQGTRVNQETQDDIALLQENIRISGALLRRVTFHAGHRLLPQNATINLGTTSFGVFGTNGTGTTPGSQDVFTVTFEGDGQPDVPSGIITDCLGDSVGIGTTVQVKAAINSGSFARTSNAFEVRTFDGRPWLGCTTGTGAWVALVPDVEGMEVEYGEDNSGDAVVDHYISAAAGIRFEQIVTARIHLLFRTTREIALDADTQTYVMGDKTYGPFNDRRVRRQITLTIGVRNAKA